MGDLTWYPDPDRPGRWLHAKFDRPPDSDPPVTHILNAIPADTGALVDVPPRVDDWCENRPVGVLTERDGRD